MTEGRSPWDDPTVAAGFQAAYEPQVPRQAGSLAVAEAPAPRPAVPRATDVLPLPLGASPHRLAPTRALTGAAMSVAGVALGITTLLWVTDGPTPDPGSVVTAPVADDEPVDPLAGSSEREAATVDPPAAVAPPATPAATPPVPASVPAPVVEPATTAPSAVVAVTVLNNSRIPGLADRGATRFAAEGWPVAETGNYRGRIRATTVYYPAGLEASAQAFAARFPGVERVLPRPENLPGGGLTVVLTRDFAS